jgi:hypothetical protein
MAGRSHESSLAERRALQNSMPLTRSTMSWSNGSSSLAIGGTSCSKCSGCQAVQLGPLAKALDDQGQSQQVD